LWGDEGLPPPKKVHKSGPEIFSDSYFGGLQIVDWPWRFWPEGRRPSFPP